MVWQPGLGSIQAVKRKVFTSYHHGGDQAWYDAFARAFSTNYDVLTDNSLNRVVGSEDVEYVMRRIRENYITGSSCTVVLVGRDTWGRKYVDWEIDATLQKEHGLIGIQLPTLPINPNNTVTVPDRLYDNIQSGYALWSHWDWVLQNPGQLPQLIEQANARPSNLVRNDRYRRLRNA
jgi:hypothetical protein